MKRINLVGAAIVLAAVVFAAGLIVGRIEPTTEALPFPTTPEGYDSYSGSFESALDALSSANQEGVREHFAATGTRFLHTEPIGLIDDEAVWAHYESQLVRWQEIGLIVDVESRRWRTWEFGDRRFTAVIVRIDPEVDLLVTYEFERRL